MQEPDRAQPGARLRYADAMLRPIARTVPRLIAVIALVALSHCVHADEQTLVVEASAYNSLRSQTNEQPDLAAWGDLLEPGMKAVAVSRDLIDLGLGHDVVIRIDGLPGEYRVMDKMARRWKKKIDIYMGEDVEAARDWGVREVVIRWSMPPG